VSAAPHIITVSKEDFEKLKAQLEQSQRNNTEIQKELQTTQQRALSQDIQLKREITQPHKKKNTLNKGYKRLNLKLKIKRENYNSLEYEN